MRKTYPIGHWFFTILFAPFVCQAIQYVYYKNPHQVVGLVEVYPITILFSIIFSMPAFLLSWALFFSLSKLETGPLISKLIMTGFSVLSIAVTFSILKMTWEIWVAYIFTAVVIGMMLKITQKKRAVGMTAP